MKLRVITGDGRLQTISYEEKEKQNLLLLLSEHHLFLPAPCGGMGNCGHCEIQLLQGELPICKEDRKYFSNDALARGSRLACKAIPQGDLTIRLPKNEIQAISIAASNSSNETPSIPITTVNEALIAIDLGTTTLAFALVDTNSHNILHSLTKINPQGTFGADVMSRMEASNRGAREQLADCIQRAVKEGILSLLTATGLAPTHLKKIILSGNTAMVHLFMGYSCKELSTYPFQPVTLAPIHTSTKALHLLDLDLPVLFMGGLSAFVGGDLRSGIFYLQAKFPNTRKEPWLLLDLGTNAEMILSDGKDNLWISSAPAGPAFEAANISCGTAAIDGAICNFSYNNQKITFETIHHKKPLGLCGSGLIDVVSELYKNALIDETGLLKDPYFAQGFPLYSDETISIVLQQKDIRALQMAKSAVYSAIQILLKKANLSYADLKNCYLAGGFGNYLNLQKAANIQLLPQELLPKIHLLGNSSLKGAIAYGLQKENSSITNDISTFSLHEVVLSNEENFASYYCKNMNF